MITRPRLVAAIFATLAAAGPARSQSCGDTVGGAVTLAADLACPSGHGLLLAPGATLDCAGHAIRGGSQPGQYGVYLRDVGGATLRNCVIEAFEVGVRLRNSPDARVEDVVVRGNLRYGIEVTQGASGAHLLRNQVLANGDEGIHVSGPDGIDAENEIAENVVDGNALEGIYLLGSDANTIRANTVRNQGAGGLRIKDSDRNLIADNTLTGDPLELIGGARENVLVGNVLVGDRVRLDGASANLLSTTSVRAAGGRPVNAYELAAASDNTITDSEARGTFEHHVVAGGGSTGNTFVHLIFTDPIGCAIAPDSSVRVTDPAGNRVACADSPGDERLADARLVLSGRSTRPTGRSLALVARDATVSLGRGALSGDDPTLVGGSLRVVAGGREAVYDLPATGWRYLGAPGFLRGYRYRDRSRASGPIGAVVLTTGRVVVARGHGPGLDQSLEGDPRPVGITLTLGLAGTRYCLEFGAGTFVPGRAFRARGASAPTTCTP